MDENLIRQGIAGGSEGRGGLSINFPIGAKKSTYRKSYGNTLHDLHNGPKSLMRPAISSGCRETVGLHREAIVSGQCAVRPVNARLFRKKCRL